MTKHLILSALLALAVAGPLRADDASPAPADNKPATIQDLDQRVRILERDLENQASDAADAKKSAAIVTASTAEGFGIYSADKGFGVKFGGLVQIDDRTFFDDYNGAVGSGAKVTAQNVSITPKNDYQADVILPRRVRLSETIFLGPKADAFLQEEFIPSSSNPAVVDAYGELKPVKWATLRVGLQKTPLSLERWRSDPARDFVEFSYLAGLVTDRDTGAWLEFKDADQVGYFGAGVFDGSSDTGSTEVVTDTNKDKDAVAKVFVQPFRLLDSVNLRDIGFGVAGSAGDHDLSALPTYKSLGQGQTIFSLSPTAATGKGTGAAYRLVPQAYAYWRGFSLLGEYLREGSDYFYAGDANNANARKGSYYLTNESWDVQAGWWLTGEDASFTPVKLNPSTSSSWGALQLVGRYSGINFDPGFNQYGLAANNGAQGVAKYTNAVVTGVKSWDAGLNYVPTNNVKLLFDYAESYFTNGGGIDAAKHNLALIPEKVLFTRVQFNF
jgi:phosphate-selective porin OprO/OprP